ncbi:MAG TPA: VWA domain-containing protein [Candidatus Solibacter sp.]|jgi:Ca-activated chloride channel family protein|nr:VWA domain-containing protein [Candidatus Solibacter sp.]
MAKQCLLLFVIVSVSLASSSAQSPATPSGATQEPQQGKNVFRVDVDLVQVNVAVTDGHGHYLTGLRPSNFVVSEDGIAEKIATFGEGSEPQQVADVAQAQGGSKPASSPEGTSDAAGSNSVLSGANVFILFDTSNYMYRGFAIAQDAIADFVRSLDGPERVAFYAYSRDLYRGATLTADRSQVLRGVRSTVAGDEPALYNALLLTLKDAVQFSGRKVIVVFSNGPDRASMVTPEDIGELAQSQGIPIYVISTREAKQDPISTAVFQRMSAATGGEAFFAKSWKDQQRAFAAIRRDVGHLYTITYYPQPNSNRGWRTIKVKLVGDATRKFHVRTRSGYRPKPAHAVGFAP